MKIYKKIKVIIENPSKAWYTTKNKDSSILQCGAFGESGPVFNGSNTVYGIHTYGGRVSNKCRRITKGLYNSWVNNGWISG